MKLFTKEIDQKLFDQYIMGSDLENQVVVAKIFNPYGNGVWYLLNSDPNDPDYIWAIVDLFDVEIGSVSREELETLKVPPFRLGLERDLYFTPMNAQKLYDALLAGEKFEDGGTIDIKKDKSGDNWVFPNNPEGDTYGIKLAAGGMTAGRWYKDNSGQELRFIGESNGKLIFKDGEKVVYKDESDFEEAPSQKRRFGLFEDGGELKDEFLNDMAKIHKEIADITLVDGSKISGEEIRNAHHKYEYGGEMGEEYEGEYEGDDRWFVLENGSIIKGGLIKKTANVLADVLRRKNPNKEYSVIFIEDYEDYDEFASGGYTSSFAGTPQRRTTLTMAKGGELTDAKKEAILRKKGNIIIFKEVLEPTDEGRKSIAVQTFVKSRRTGAVKIEGSAYDTQWFDSMQDLINSVDWSKWENNKMADGGEIMKHKHNENITIELIEPTNKGWKVKQIETHSIGGRKLSTPKEKVAYFSKEEISDLFEPTMAMGGRTKFKDKVQSIKASLLKRKKVSPKVQKDYGKTYSPKEAEESAKRIVGSMVKKEKRQPRVSKMLEKMKKGTELKKKKSTFNDRMKQLSTKIKERKSKSTK